MTEYFLNINKNNNIYCNCSCKMGRTWIHQQLWAKIAKYKNCCIPKWDRAQNFVAGRSLMVQNTENDPDMP
jgi:hypothetical protein